MEDFSNDGAIDIFYRVSRWVEDHDGFARMCLNGGDIDIVTAGELYADTIAIYLNDGNGAFEVANMGADFGGADDGKPRVATVMCAVSAVRSSRGRYQR